MVDTEEVQRETDSIFRKFDKNEDGKIDKEEFRALYDASKDKWTEFEGIPDINDYDAVFAFFDKNGNGGIEKPEIAALITSLMEKAMNE